MMSEDSSNTAKRRQVIKTLKKLSSNYELLTATFTHGKDAYIKLTELPGDTFTSNSSIFDPDFLAKMSPTLKTFLLIDSIGKDFSKEELLDRFHTTPKQSRKALKELNTLIP